MICCTAFIYWLALLALYVSAAQTIFSWIMLSHMSHCSLWQTCLLCTTPVCFFHFFFHQGQIFILTSFKTFSHKNKHNCSESANLSLTDFFFIFIFLESSWHASEDFVKANMTAAIANYPELCELTAQILGLSEGHLCWRVCKAAAHWGVQQQTQMLSWFFFSPWLLLTVITAVETVLPKGPPHTHPKRNRKNHEHNSKQTVFFLFLLENKCKVDYNPPVVLESKWQLRPLKPQRSKASRWVKGDIIIIIIIKIHFFGC